MNTYYLWKYKCRSNYPVATAYSVYVTETSSIQQAAEQGEAYMKNAGAMYPSKDVELVYLGYLQPSNMVDPKKPIIVETGEY